MSSDSEELRQRAEQFNHQLLTSEDQYVNELETIVTYIVKPLEKAAVRCKIPGGEDQVKKVFKYLNSMLQFHITFLSVIRETISVIPDLYKYIGFITMYNDYLQQYDGILEIFATWRSMEFREFITMRLKHKNVKKTIIDRLDSLPWYLYRPFDRIKEYHRFLKDVEKVTKKSDDTHSTVYKTLTKIRPLYKKIKQNEDRLQQKTRLLEVQLQIHGYNGSLVKKDRFFVYNRQCQMKRNGLRRNYKHIQVYLFSDLFLWVSARGRFKGSYSFLKENLDIQIPSNSKPGDAIFSIGLKTEKHQRLIVCADDMQRDKLMNTIIRTYKSCQQKLFKTLNGTNKDAIKQVKKRAIRDTNIKGDNEFSASSLDTRNTYNNEYSISASDRTDITDTAHHSQSILHVHGNNNSNSYKSLNNTQQPHQPISPPDNSHANGGKNGYHNPLQTVKENAEYGDRRNTNHLVPDQKNGGHGAYDEPSNSVDESSVGSGIKIPLNGNGHHNNDSNNPSPKSELSHNNITPKHQNGNVTPIGRDIIAGNFNGIQKTTTITPEPSVEMNPQPSIEDISNNPSPISLNGKESNSFSQSMQVMNDINGGGIRKPKSHHPNAKRSRSQDRKSKHRPGHKSRREQIRELQEELEAMKQQLATKDDRIKDLEQSNKTIRQTLILKDNKIHSLQDEVQHLRMKMSSHNVRAKSISNVMRHPRIKRASSFSIGKGGKITRTAMLPSQLDHNKKIRKQQQNGLSINNLNGLNNDYLYSSNGSQTPSSSTNGNHATYNISSTRNGRLKTPNNGLKRAHSENHRKAKSNHFDLSKKSTSSYYSSSYQ